MVKYSSIVMCSSCPYYASGFYSELANKRISDNMYWGKSNIEALTKLLLFLQQSQYTPHYIANDDLYWALQEAIRLTEFYIEAVEIYNSLSRNKV